MVKKVKTLFLQLLPLLIITVPAILPLLHAGYFSMHDDQHIARLYLLDQGISQGYLFPRWVDTLGFGFGYPLFNFYPPLIYYVAEVFHVLGFSFIWSIKCMVLTGFILGAIGMYYICKPYIGKAAALLASVLYTYFTYHAVVVYVRGAYAEFFAMSLLPFLFASVFKLYRNPSKNNSILFGILFELIILSHPLIAFPAILYIGLFFIFFTLRHSGLPRILFIQHFIKSLIIGLALSAFFWFPSLIEKKYTLVDRVLTSELASYKIHFVYPEQFWYSPWGYGASVKGLADGLSFQLGKIHIGLAIFAIIFLCIYVYFVRAKKLDWSKKFPAIFFFYVSLFLCLVSLFLATPYSQFIWDRVLFLSYLQFPWRYLTFVAVFISICGACSIYFITHLIQKLNTKMILFGITLLLSMLTIMQYQKYFTPQRYIDTTDTERTSFEEIAWRVSRTSYEFVPKEVKTTKTNLGTTIIDIKKDQLPSSPYNIINGSADVTILKNNFNEKVFQISAITNATFQLNTYNFPGWRSVTASEARQSQTQLSISDSNPYKLITVQIPQGIHTVVFKFEDTSVRKFATAISAITFVIVLYALFPVFLKR